VDAKIIETYKPENYEIQSQILGEKRMITQPCQIRVFRMGWSGFFKNIKKDRKGRFPGPGFGANPRIS